MSIKLLNLISRFVPRKDRENHIAWFKTLVPWVAPEAYLNIVFKPPPSKVLTEAAQTWSFPPAVVDFLREQNGAILFSGALSLFGVVEPAWLLNREDPLSLPPFNIEDENESWSLDREQLVVVGGYQIDGSRGCVERSTGRVHVFKRRQKKPMASWPSLEAWLNDEIARLSLLFDVEGRMTASESETGPPPHPTQRNGSP